MPQIPFIERNPNTINLIVTRPRLAKNVGGRLVMNLVDQFENAAFVYNWLHAVTDLAAHDGAGPEHNNHLFVASTRIASGHVGCSTATPQPTRGSIHSGEWPPHVQQCIPGSVYGEFGAQLL